MRQLRRVLLVLLTVALARPGNGCSYPERKEIFSQLVDPDRPYTKFVAGRLGVLASTYRIRHLIVAYNTLSGRGLSPAEQKAAEAVDRYYNPHAYDMNASDGDQQPGDDTAGSGLQQWNASPVSNTERAVPGEGYETFTNCLDDAFAHAAATIADRRDRYGKRGAHAADTPEIADWIAGQRAVFSNCNGAGQSPQPVSTGAPLWLRHDRAYQSAAASFYATDYDVALAGFRAIAKDHTSPWATLARYLVARTLIRKAVVPYQFDGGTVEQTEANNAKLHEGLAEARAELESILRDPAMEPFHRQSAHLLDYVMIRLDPQVQAEELTRRLTKTVSAKSGSADAIDADYRQNMIDLSFVYRSLPLYASALVRQDAKERAAAAVRAPLLRWIDDLQVSEPPSSGSGLGSAYQQLRNAAERRADALATWRATHSEQWLVAALTVAEPGGDDSEDLIAAALAVPASSPAYASVTYHRLRLAGTVVARGNSPQLYGEVSTLLPRIEQTQPRSAINLFADLQAKFAPTLDSYLRAATRLPASLGDVEGGEGDPLPHPDAQHTVTLCGVDLYAPETQHLDEETAVIFNQRMPLRVLREAALSPALPGNVRFQLTHMAWTRALLLDDRDTARSLAPYLASCQSAFKPWVEQYDAAKTADERHVLGLLAIMRFPSTEPTVRAGLERDFAVYDRFRDNWWCSARTTAQGSAPAAPGDHPATLFLQDLVPRGAQPDPPFLSAADRASVEQELAKLETIPAASDYLAKEALSWVKEHPDDSHDADVLGFAMRVVRNACRSDATDELNHQLFNILHRRFSKSEWARRYTTWE